MDAAPVLPKTEPAAEPTFLQIEVAPFEAAYDALLVELAETRPALAAALRPRRYRIQHNRWEYTVPNPHEANLLLSAKDYLQDYFRDRCTNPSIVLTVQVDETLQPKEEDKTLTEEGIRKRMVQLNPDLALLEHRFNTRIG